jgi:hypothetical protein
MIASTFLFSFWEERFNQRLIIRDRIHQITHQVFLNSSHRSRRITTYSDNSVNQVLFAITFRVQWRVHSNTCSDLCFEDFNSSFFLFVFLSFSLIFYHYFAFFAFFAVFIWRSWIIHDFNDNLDFKRSVNFDISYNSSDSLFISFRTERFELFISHKVISIH